MAESFEQLRLEFLAETEDTLEALQRDLNRLGESVGRGAPEADVVDRVFRTTHSLKGVAGMFGLDDMSAVSHAMESVFDRLRHGRLPFDDTVLDLLYQGNESLHHLLAHASGRVSGPPASANAVIHELERHLSRQEPEEDPALADADPLVGALPHLDDAAQQAIREEWSAGATIVVVEGCFPEEGFEPALRELLDRIRAWGTMHGTAPGDAPEETGTFRVRAVASSSEEAFPLMRSTGELGAEVLPCDPALVFGAEADDGEAEPGEGAAGDAAARVGEPTSVETLRVPVDRVDRLLSGLGDVIQAKLGLDSTALGLLGASSNRMQRTTLTQALRNLDRRLRLLQDEVLRTRMITLAPTFQLLERTLRESSRATGKAARLVTTGDRVELDKRVVEALTEPLVHLVRNAVDHGLESAETREAQGKSRVGTVRIDARPRGGYTELEISDDGAGLDLSRVEQKARTMGLVGDDENPAPAELRDLIFHPGLTVRDQATAISGRGVGLDAVRATVAELGGLLHVDSGPGGTTFSLRIPTSLAIVKALLVEAAGQEFFLPLASVAEVGHLKPAELEIVAGEEMLIRDGRAIPVEDLAHILGLARESSDPPPLAVFLGLAERRLVLRVDRLGGQQEIVVRGLSELLPAAPGVSGATELGDGRTVLILDPGTLFERVRGGGVIS